MMETVELKTSSTVIISGKANYTSGDAFSQIVTE